MFNLSLGALCQITMHLMFPYFRETSPAMRRCHLKSPYKRVEESGCCTLPAGSAETPLGKPHWVIRQGSSPTSRQFLDFFHVKATSVNRSYASWNAGAEWKEQCCLSEEALTEAQVSTSFSTHSDLLHNAGEGHFIMVKR